MAAINTAEKLTAPSPRLKRRNLLDGVFSVFGLVATLFGLVVLGVLVLDLMRNGASKLDVHFLTSFPASYAADAGILSAWVGSILVILTTAAIAIPLGVMAGLHLEEYAGRNWVTSAIEVTVNNLAGVPSIIYGLLALGLFVYGLGADNELFGQTILTSGMTLALLVLPVVIVATREAVRAVPNGIREAALSVGASTWQATSHHVLPYATPGIITGVIIALSRAIGETAPLILVGALTFVAFLPFVTPDQVGQAYFDAAGNQATITHGDMFLSWLPWAPGGQGWLSQPFTVLPIQMFNWTSRPEKEFLENAAAAGVILLVVTLVLNGFAIWLRYRLRKNIRW
jgi:phosphate transport system permease protein